MRLKTVSIIGLMLSSLVGCASSSLYQKVLHVPSWILSPSVDDGLAISQCVTWTGDYNSNKSQARDKSIIETKRYLMARVEHFNPSWKTEQDRQSVNEVVDSGRVIKVDFAAMEDQEQLCTLWFVEDKKLNKLLGAVSAHHNVSITGQQADDFLQVIKSN